MIVTTHNNRLHSYWAQVRALHIYHAMILLCSAQTAIQTIESTCCRKKTRLDDHRKNETVWIEQWPIWAAEEDDDDDKNNQNAALNTNKFKM